jgi:hypothetical protein
VLAVLATMEHGRSMAGLGAGPFPCSIIDKGLACPNGVL